MIAIPAGVRVLVATRPVDFRKGADSLAALAQATLMQDPHGGTVIVFRARRADRVKIIAWDGTGLVMDRVPSGGVTRRLGHRDLRQGRIDQLAITGKLTRGSSLKGATDSRVM